MNFEKALAIVVKASMSNLDLREGNNTRRKSIWNLDDQIHFEVPLFFVEAPTTTPQLKDNRHQSAHDRDPNYPLPAYTRYAY